MKQCRPTDKPSLRIDQIFEDPHYEVRTDHWQMRTPRRRAPRLRVLQQRIRDAHTAVL